MIQSVTQYLQRVFASILAALAVFSFGRNMDAVSLTVENGVTDHSEAFVLEMHNETGGRITIDHYLTLEKKEGDTWIPVTQYGGMIETAGTLPAGATFRQKVDIVSLFGGYLTAREYRVSKTYSRTNIVQPQYVCTAYFTVTSVENKKR